MRVSVSLRVPGAAFKGVQVRIVLRQACTPHLGTGERDYAIMHHTKLIEDESIVLVDEAAKARDQAAMHCRHTRVGRLRHAGQSAFNASVPTAADQPWKRAESAKVSAHIPWLQDGAGPAPRSPRMFRVRGTAPTQGQRYAAAGLPCVSLLPCTTLMENRVRGRHCCTWRHATGQRSRATVTAAFRQVRRGTKTKGGRGW